MPPNATAADKRRAEWSQRREKMWMTAVVATSFLFIFLSTAEFIYAKSSTALSPTAAVTLVGSQVTVPTADVNDDKLHRYGVHVDDGKGGNVEVRFLLFRKPDGNIVTVARRLPDLRPGRLLHRQPGHHLQDVRLAPRTPRRWARRAAAIPFR